MRATPWLAVFLVGSLLVFLIQQTDNHGAALRAQEQGAAQTLLEIMLAQERRRLEFGDADPGTPARLYAELGELLDSGAVNNLQRIDDPSGRELFLRDGYIIQLVLQDEYDVAASNDGESITGGTIGQRYVVWAWPADENNVSLVLYFGSNAGFLIQCENGTIAGRRATAPLEANPLDDFLKENQFKAVRQHFSLADIRGDRGEWAEWLRGGEPLQ